MDPEFARDLRERMSASLGSLNVRRSCFPMTPRDRIFAGTLNVSGKPGQAQHDVDGDRATVVVGEAEVVMGRLHLHANSFLPPLTELHRAHFVSRSRKRSRSLR